MAYDVFIKELREKNQLSQTDIADIMGISRTSVQLIENGSTKFPSKKVLTKLSNYLNKSEVSVMARILFDDLPLDNEINKYIVQRYLAHMYLEGWNIECSPYIYPVTSIYKLEFDGKMVKKREPKNSIIVAKYNRFLIRLDSVESVNDAQGYMGDMLSIVMTVLDDFRSVDILFDFNDSKQRQMFDYFKQIKYRKIGFDIKFILFDLVNDLIAEEITYK